MTAQQVFAAIMHAAERQLATSEPELDTAAVRALIEKIAANAANPIALDIEDAIIAATK